MYSGVLNPLDSLCRETAALAFRVEVLSIKALLFWRQLGFGADLADKPIISSPSISILQTTGKSTSEVIEYNKTITTLTQSLTRLAPESILMCWKQY